jgi:hypothetical protein
MRDQAEPDGSLQAFVYCCFDETVEISVFFIMACFGLPRRRLFGRPDVVA